MSPQVCRTITISLWLPMVASPIHRTVAMASPTDTIEPVIVHNAPAFALVSENLTLRATATDNIGVQEVTLYYRAVGASDWESRTMVLTQNDLYSTTLEGALVTEIGLEYYIAVKDAVNTVTSGSAAAPNAVEVTLASDQDSGRRWGLQWGRCLPAECQRNRGSRR